MKTTLLTSSIASHVLDPPEIIHPAKFPAEHVKQVSLHTALFTAVIEIGTVTKMFGVDSVVGCCSEIVFLVTGGRVLVDIIGGGILEELLVGGWFVGVVFGRLWLVIGNVVCVIVGGIIVVPPVGETTEEVHIAVERC